MGLVSQRQRVLSYLRLGMLTRRSAPGGACSRWRPWIGDIIVVGAAASVDLMVWGGDSDLREGLFGGGTLQPWVIPFLTAVVYPVLLLRWRYPRVVFAVHWSYALAGVPLHQYVPFAGLLVALHALSRRAPTGWACAGLSACAVPFAVNAYNVADQASVGNWTWNFAGTMLLWTALTLTVWGLGRRTYASERRLEHERQLRESQQVQAAEAVRAERLHLARELHDIVSHSVSAMILQAAGARTLVTQDDGQVREALEAIESTGVQAMGELHRLLGLLRIARPEDHLNGTSSAESLQDLDTLVRSTRASGVDVEVVVDGYPAELDRSVSLTAYRIVQEALTNTIKHAGRGAAVRVHLFWKPEGLTLTIRDRTGLRGNEASKLSSGHGLAGLTERVTLVGGTLKAGPAPDGFLVQAHLPTRLPDQHRKPAANSHQDSL